MIKGAYVVGSCLWAMKLLSCSKSRYDVLVAIKFDFASADLPSSCPTSSYFALSQVHLFSEAVRSIAQEGRLMDNTNLTLLPSLLCLFVCVVCPET